MVCGSNFLESSEEQSRKIVHKVAVSAKLILQNEPRLNKFPFCLLEWADIFPMQKKKPEKIDSSTWEPVACRLITPPWSDHVQQARWSRVGRLGVLSHANPHRPRQQRIKGFVFLQTCDLFLNENPYCCFRGKEEWMQCFHGIWKDLHEYKRELEEITKSTAENQAVFFPHTAARGCLRQTHKQLSAHPQSLSSRACT